MWRDVGGIGMLVSVTRRGRGARKHLWRAP